MSLWIIGLVAIVFLPAVFILTERILAYGDHRQRLEMDAKFNALRAAGEGIMGRSKT